MQEQLPTSKNLRARIYELLPLTYPHRGAEMRMIEKSGLPEDDGVGARTMKTIAKCRHWARAGAVQLFAEMGTVLDSLGEGWLCRIISTIFMARQRHTQSHPRHSRVNDGIRSPPL